MKKKVDDRIRQLVDNAVENHHRGLIVMVGDRGKYQVATLQYMLSRASVKASRSVLWCYKKELGFSSNRKKRMKQLKRQAQRGLGDGSESSDPFELFISTTNIRYLYYHESHKVLGNTFGMCVLQDFEALTPNLLARTVECVEGGGLVILLLRTMSSLRQLYSMAMDVHSKLKTEAYSDVVPRFNERFLLSLCDCHAAIVADDEMNVLPISQHMKTGLTSSSYAKQLEQQRSEKERQERELKELKATMENSPPIDVLLNHAKTLDQARAILTMSEAITEKTLKSTVALTAARGRGKSAALGLAIAMAIACDYSNIFVTSPAPENVQTLFDFVLRGLQSMQYVEHTDYEVLKTYAGSKDASSSDSGAASNQVITRINVFRSHRQSIQYIDPTKAAVKGTVSPLIQSELLVIDEAAAIPLPIVQAMLGPYLVFLCSTVSGYEGTGRSLSLKLFAQLRKEAASKSSSLSSGRVFREIQMKDPIRYSANDPVEAWLNELLCLNAGETAVGGGAGPLTQATPHPDKCVLYRVDRDALFSHHRVAEEFLRKIMALFVSSHYKNSPNDLQMLSDAPAHQLYVLLSPVSNSSFSNTGEGSTNLPDVLVAIQVSLEGSIQSDTAHASASRGHRASGDLIPWTLSQQFQDSHFASLRGARIVRVATHPDAQKLGYGSKALQLLLDYMVGKLGVLQTQKVGVEEELKKIRSEEMSMYGKIPKPSKSKETDDGGDGDTHDVPDEKTKEMLKKLREEDVTPRKEIPPLLQRVENLERHELDYLGVSFGVTQSLFSFWSRLEFVPLYIRLTPNELTGEHTCIMIHALDETSREWLSLYHQDFRKRLVQLLGYSLRELEPGLALGLLQDIRRWPASRNAAAKAGQDDAGDHAGTENEKPDDSGEEWSDQKLAELFSAYDSRRLESYSRNLADFHIVIDLLPIIAQHYFLGSFGSRVSLSMAQGAILMSLGLQHLTIEDLERSLQLPVNQILALFNKMMRKFSKVVQTVLETVIEDKDKTKTSERPTFDANPESNARSGGDEAAREMSDDAEGEDGLESSKKKKKKKRKHDSEKES